MQELYRLVEAAQSSSQIRASNTKSRLYAGFARKVKHSIRTVKSCGGVPIEICPQYLITPKCGSTKMRIALPQKQAAQLKQMQCFMKRGRGLVGEGGSQRGARGGFVVHMLRDTEEQLLVPHNTCLRHSPEHNPSLTCTHYTTSEQCFEARLPRLLAFEDRRTQDDFRNNNVAGHTETFTSTYKLSIVGPGPQAEWPTLWLLRVRWSL